MSSLRRASSIFLTLLRLGLTLIALFWIIQFAVSNWTGMVDSFDRIDAKTLLIASVFAVVGLVPGAWAWQQLMSGHIPDLTAYGGVLIYLRSGIGKYTPGGALAFAIQHKTLADERATPLRLIRVFAGIAVAACLAAVLIGLPALAALTHQPVQLALAIGLFSIVGLVWVSHQQNWFFASKLADWVGVPPPRPFTLATGTMACAWTLTGMHLIALGQDLGADPIFLISAFALSAIVGVVFAILPGAFGVRDGALAAILSTQLAPADALALALLSRALIIGADLLGTVIAAMLLQTSLRVSHRKVISQ